MHRNPLLALLAEYAARWPQEAAVSARFTDFVRAQPRCFERSLLTGHVTGSAWVTSADGMRVLLTHHAKLDLWVQLGGHADGDADILRVAWREASEESGLTGLEPVSTAVFDLDIHAIPARGAEPRHLHYDVRFAFAATAGEEFRRSAESKALEWRPVAELNRRTQEASMLRMAEKWGHHRSQRRL